MKTKDIVYLVLAGLIFVTAGILAYGSLAGKQSSGVQVEVVVPISAEYDQSALSKLTDPAVAKDFSIPVDLSSGLGNPAPFGQ
jgi:hypothetical protein